MLLRYYLLHQIEHKLPCFFLQYLSDIGGSQDELCWIFLVFQNGIRGLPVVSLERVIQQVTWGGGDRICCVRGAPIHLAAAVQAKAACIDARLCLSLWCTYTHTHAHIHHAHMYMYMYTCCWLATTYARMAALPPL